MVDPSHFHSPIDQVRISSKQITKKGPHSTTVFAHWTNGKGGTVRVSAVGAAGSFCLERMTLFISFQQSIIDSAE